MRIYLVRPRTHFKLWNSSTYSSTSDDIHHIDSLLLDLATLRIATADFDNSKMLGKGGFGMVYKVQNYTMYSLCFGGRKSGFVSYVFLQRTKYLYFDRESYLTVKK